MNIINLKKIKLKVIRRLILSIFIATSSPYPILYAQDYTDSQEIEFDEKNIKSNQPSNVIWEHVIENNDKFNNNIIWEKIDSNDEIDLKRSNKIPLTINKKSNILGINKYEQIYNQGTELKLLNLGSAVPNAYTINQGELQFKFIQIQPFNKGDFIGGTGNQNYSGSINYGLTDTLMIEAFYSHSDDPLQNKNH